MRAIHPIKLGDGHMRHIEQWLGERQLVAIELVVQFAQTIAAVANTKEDSGCGGYESFNVTDFDFERHDLRTEGAKAPERLLLGAQQRAGREDRYVRRQMSVLGVEFGAEVLHKLAQIALDVRDQGVQIGKGFSRHRENKQPNGLQEPAGPTVLLERSQL